MKISLENWIRNKLQENEEMHDYAVATETVRIWIDEYNAEIHHCGNPLTDKEIKHDHCLKCGEYLQDDED